MTEKTRPGEAKFVMSKPRRGEVVPTRRGTPYTRVVEQAAGLDVGQSFEVKFPDAPNADEFRQIRRTIVNRLTTIKRKTGNSFWLRTVGANCILIGRDR